MRGVRVGQEGQERVRRVQPCRGGAEEGEWCLDGVETEASEWCKNGA